MSRDPQHPPTSAKDLLASVSRSFAISLNLLPPPLREPITVAYLLARLTDTLADAPQVSAEQRIDALGQLDRLIQSGEKEGRASLQKDLIREYLPEHDHAGEVVLLSRVEAMLDRYDHCKSGERKLIRAALLEIARGQHLDLVRFGDSDERRSLKTEAELEEYAYLVAGCVGGFWTRIGLEVDPCFLAEGVALEEAVETGIEYGKALQFLNIYRDAGNDLAEGRCYFPANKMKAQGLALGDLEKNPAAFREAWKPWREKCEQGLVAGLEYTTQLTSKRCRLASGLPALIGLQTLTAIDEADDEAWLRGVKIDRPQVKRLFFKGGVASLTRRGIQRLGRSLRSCTE